VLVRRDNFKRQPDDSDKINTYINHRGANHPEVVALKMADDRQKGIDRNTIAMSQEFDKYYKAVDPQGSPKPYWMAENTYRVLQLQPPVALSRFDVDERDKLRALAKCDFCRYYYNIHQHTIIEFYMAARAHDSKLCYGPKSSSERWKEV
jgi:hypothetical protein